jgi:hypothetical protein
MGGRVIGEGGEGWSEGGEGGLEGGRLVGGWGKARGRKAEEGRKSKRVWEGFSGKSGRKRRRRIEASKFKSEIPWAISRIIVLRNFFFGFSPSNILLST